MFTETSDCLQIGNLRRTSKAYKTIPAVQFPCETELGSCEIMVLALTFGSPVVRLTLEAMYLTSIGQMNEEDLKDLVVNRLPSNSDNEVELSSILRTLRSARIEDYNGEISLKVSSDTLGSIFSVLANEGCLSFSCIHEIPHSTLVLSFDIITEEYLTSVCGEQTTEILSEISSNDEYLGHLSRYFYPEDCFIGRGNLFLSYLNSISGGSYKAYDTLKYAYRVNDHFRENPDFFNKTHCQCGGELVVRKQNGEYTLMSCINPYCYEKMAFSLADFARAMGVDGLGAVTFMDMCRGLALQNLEVNGNVAVTYKMLLQDSSAIYLGDANSLRWGDFLTAIEEYTGTVKDLVMAMNLPYISSDASRILTGVILQNKELNPDTLVQACNREGKYDMKFVLNLWMNLEDIRYVALEMAKALNLNIVDEYVIYITKGVRLQLDDGKVINYTKKQFEILVNHTLQQAGMEKVRLKINNSLTHKCNVLIADQGQDTGSCRTAESYGIPILTSREFLQQLGGGALE